MTTTALPGVPDHVQVAVIGAGFAGIGTAMQLARHTAHSFVILERAAEVGGTWRDNVYPGVACDIPSHLYSFSFAPKPDWQRHYATGTEIQQYLRDCAAEPGVAERLHCNTVLHTARWDARAAHWKLTTNRGSFTASVLVLGSGRFGTPQIPALPGIASFQGPVCHSARWDPAITQDMTVAVVGSGASAIQVVPALARSGARVASIQRSAPWVIPKGDHAYSPAQQKIFAVDDATRKAYRQEIFDTADAGFAARLLGSSEQAALQERAIEHLRAHITDPEVLEVLTPDYEIGCKRVLLSDDFYPTVASGQASVHRGMIEHIDGQRLTLSDGTAITADAIVFATGFEASRPHIAGQIYGCDGVLLEHHWEHGMVSYGSTVVSGFPNMFLLGGPNGALGHNSALAIMETQIDHLCSALKVLDTGWAAFEVKLAAEQDYTRIIDERAADTVWLSQGCTSWYRHDRTGRLSLVWPGTAAEYAEQYSRFDPTKFDLTAARPHQPVV